MNRKKLMICILIVVILVSAPIAVLMVQQRTKSKGTNSQIVLKETKAEMQTIIKQFSGGLEVSSGLIEKVELHRNILF